MVSFESNSPETHFYAQHIYQNMYKPQRNLNTINIEKRLRNTKKSKKLNFYQEINVYFKQLENV